MLVDLDTDELLAVHALAEAGDPLMAALWERLRRATHRHFKGRDYRVVARAVHTETMEVLNLYLCAGPDEAAVASDAWRRRQHKAAAWARPARMFDERVPRPEQVGLFDPDRMPEHGELMPRFVKLP